MARDGARSRVFRRRLVLLELSLALVVLVIAMLGLFDVGRLYYARASVRNQIAEAAQLARRPGVSNPETGERMTRAESVKRFIESGAGSLPVKLESVVVDTAHDGEPDHVARILAVYSFSFVASPLVRLFREDELFFAVEVEVAN